MESAFLGTCPDRALPVLQHREDDRIREALRRAEDLERDGLEPVEPIVGRGDPDVAVGALADQGEGVRGQAFCGGPVFDEIGRRGLLAAGRRR
jgi:hypothetical protein